MYSTGLFTPSTHAQFLALSECLRLKLASFRGGVDGRVCFEARSHAVGACLSPIQAISLPVKLSMIPTLRRSAGCDHDDGRLEALEQRDKTGFATPSYNNAIVLGSVFWEHAKLSRVHLKASFRRAQSAYCCRGLSKRTCGVS